jgi:hypothetical protein
MNLHGPDNDIRELWQNLETKETTVSAEEIQLKAIESLRRRRRDLIVRLAFAIAASVFCVLAFTRTSVNPIRYLAAVVMAMLLISTIRNLYVFYRDTRQIAQDPGAPWSSCASFYRSELEQQRLFGAVPIWQMLAALAVLGWLARRSSLRRIRADVLEIVFPVVLLGAAGLVILMAIRKFQARRVEAELDALNRFEEDNDLGDSEDITKSK